MTATNEETPRTASPFFKRLLPEVIGAHEYILDYPVFSWVQMLLECSQYPKPLPGRCQHFLPSTLAVEGEQRLRAISLPISGQPLALVRRGIVPVGGKGFLVHRLLAAFRFGHEIPLRLVGLDPATGVGVAS